ncbi:beta-1,4-galactosyltransferase 7 [Olea europaea subsp. europaea]|uniref:Beta-1,4-galactosyltransferase 7 n=1 Tax=Olea europaea subsp. europaea TaxID=158383 RepID=A0A8S0TRA5_OLEEU|nr:beta-1,4-galactosyltransferase 7 [Olea europaea subsp. europaea]
MLSYLVGRRRRLVATLISILVTIYILTRHKKVSHEEDADAAFEETTKGPRLAILVPFRDRFDELMTFVPYMTRYLQNQPIGPFKIFILNQSNKYRFNRGALANVGFMLAKSQSDYIAIHDIDLIPVNRNLSYGYPETGPHHLTAPEYHPNYNYDKYFGGILLISNEHFELVNGFSNRYFGWGLEDDEFYTRVKAAKLKISRPMNLTTGKNDTFIHFHYGRKRDSNRSREQRDALKYRDRITGLRDLKYSVTSKHSLMIDGEFECLVFNIELHCDTKQTPWCLPNHTKQRGHATSKKTTTQ